MDRLIKRFLAVGAELFDREADLHLPMRMRLTHSVVPAFAVPCTAEQRDCLFFQNLPNL